MKATSVVLLAMGMVTAFGQLRWRRMLRPRRTVFAG